MVRLEQALGVGIGRSDPIGYHRFRSCQAGIFHQHIAVRIVCRWQSDLTSIAGIRSLLYELLFVVKISFKGEIHLDRLVQRLRSRSVPEVIE